MSLALFQDPADLTEVEIIEDRALPIAESMGGKLSMVAALGLAGFIAGGPMVAGAAALVPAWLILESLGRGMRNHTFVRRNPGCVAHLIKSEPDMRIWLEELGETEVRRQLLTAMRHNQPLSRAAKNLAAELVPEAERPARTAREHLGKLRSAAVDVQALPVNEQSLTPEAPQLAVELPQVAVESQVLRTVVESPGISWLIPGGQRCGKSYFAAAASRELAKQGWKIYHINLASYGNEDSYYWSHCIRSVVGDLSTISSVEAATDLVYDAIEVLEEFKASENAILIADEITYTGSKYGRYSAVMQEFLADLAGQISALTSTGMKRKRAVWALCPEMVAGALVGPAKAIKSLKLCYFAIAPGQSVEWDGKPIKFDASLHEQLAYNFEVAMPTDAEAAGFRRAGEPRIVFMNGVWHALGQLPKIEPPLTLAEQPSGEVIEVNPRAEKVHELLAEGRSQTQIIWDVWGVRKGGSEAYKAAVAEYKQIVEVQV